MGVWRSMSKFAALCAVLAALAACTQVDKAAAIKLADAGKVAATNGAAEAAAARADFVADGERSAALTLLGKVNVANYGAASDFDAPVQAETDKRRHITAILARRDAAFTALAALYSEMSGLAAANPGADVRTATAELIDKINGLTAAVNMAMPALSPLPMITKTVGAVFGEVAALYAEERQRQEILVTNKIVREALSALRERIDREAQYATSLRQSSANARGELAVALLRLNLADQSPVISRIAELSGTTPKDIVATLADASISGNDTQKIHQRIVWALAGFEQFRIDAKTRQIAESYETLVKALEQLDAGHAKLAAGTRIDIELIAAWGERLKDAAERVRDASEAR